MHHLVLRVAVVATLAAGVGTLSGCSHNPTQPSGTIPQLTADDMALQVAAGMATDDGGLLSTIDAAGGGGAMLSPGGARLAATTAAETTFTSGGMTYTLSRTYYDAAGNPLPSFDPVLTERVVDVWRAVGAIVTPRFNASIGRAGSLDLRGLSPLEDTLTANAVSADTCQSSFTSLDGMRMRYFYLVAACTWQDVRWVKPVSSAPWPVSGTATWTLHADRLRSNNRADVEAHIDVVVVVTFNGTRTADVDVAGQWRYHIDLETGQVARA